MGMTAAQRAKYDSDLAALAPVVKDEPVEEKPKCKHGCADVPCRHTRTEEKHKKHIGKELRGIPLVGSGPGVIDGTRPGDPSYIIEEANRELHAAMMRKARANLRRKT